MSKLICPHCGAFTSFSPASIIGKGVLLGRSTENTTEWGQVQVQAITPYKYEDDTYAIVDCQACYECFVAKREKWNSEDSEDWSAVYPVSHRPVAEEIPEPIKGEFEEANLCFAVGAYTGCLLVCRAVLITLQREQGVSGLKELKEKGTISNLLYGQADQVRLWANMIGHEDVPEPIAKEDCEELLAYLEALLDDVYVKPKRLTSLSEKRQQLKKEQ